MKKIYSLVMMLALFAFGACSVDAGTEPGNDTVPNVLLGQFSVSLPYNVDNDTWLRLTSNSATQEVYYFVEPSADREARMSSLGEEGYISHVISNGTKVEGLQGHKTEDLIITGIVGNNIISVVAVGNGAQKMFVASFNGLEWNDIAAGTYKFKGSKDFVAVSGLTEQKTVLQVCTTDKTLYRFKDLFGKGYSMKLKMLELTGKDQDGEYTFFRVPVAQTPFEVKGKGEIGVRDIGYWQGNDSFVTDGGYESGMYADKTCFVYVQYFAPGANLGYGYDSFTPDK